MIDLIKLKSVISEWSFRDHSPPQSVPRGILNTVLDWDADLVWVIQGVRRCGKSTLLAQIMTHQKDLPLQNCFFINFEDPRLSDHLTYELLDQIVKIAEQECPPNAGLYFFFDEIQNVKKWEKWLHKELERPSRKHFVITGSNATLLAGELATALTGRHRTIELFPFDFFEYQKLRPKNSLENYLEDGGFPKALMSSKPDELLREYFTDIIERDVRRHVATRNTPAIVQIAKAVFESTGSETSFRKLASIFGTTPDTVRSYIHACSMAYLILPCPYFTFSERKRAVRPNKYYPIDTGLHRAIITKGGGDRGKLLETVVYHQLRKKFGPVFYWRGKKEVDFVVLDKTSIVPYQVTWGEPKERHLGADEEFRKEFPKAKPVQFINQENYLSLQF